MKKYPAYIVGNGNLGFHIAELFNAHKIPYERLNREVLKTPTIYKKDTVVWLCIPDSEVPQWIEFLRPSEAIVIYCSGGLALHEDWKSYVGVWYPLYSFRKELPIDWNLVPLFTEAYDTRVLQYLSDLSETLSVPSQFCTSHQRGVFHLAAVFVNNFTNALFSSAETILVGVPREQIIQALWPIAHLTVTRWATNPASQSQTGPAVRSDQETINTHIELLKDFPKESVIYETITQYIAQKIKQKD